jgi:hypothetical protein
MLAVGRETAKDSSGWVMGESLSAPESRRDFGIVTG